MLQRDQSFAPPRSLIHAFKEQVAQGPDRPALLTPDECWTYTALDRRSDAIANALLVAGDHGRARTALLFDQGVANVAATLGALKAGTCYVPLDPAHAYERSLDLFAFAGATVLLTDADHAPLAYRIAQDPSKVVVIDTLGEADPVDHPVCDQHDAAYIFFTSGSTGKPKGVVDSHRNVLHNIHRYSMALGITRDDRLTMIQSPVFSGTVSSLFCALLNGATLLPFDVRKLGFAALGQWLIDSRATIYHSVPSIYRGVLETTPAQPHIRVVRLEGDGATRQDLDLFARSFNSTAILAHGLGATETGLSCQYRMQGDAVFDGDRLPIGSPLPDIDIRVIGSDGEPVADGEIGELEVRSAFLATGYWRAPDLTSERFAPTSANEVRAYRTGDLGRKDDAGRFIHLGRKDLEYKVNGQWVDIGEVENALNAIGCFAKVFATTRKDGTSDARLVAYVVLKEGAREETTRWREELMDRLPDHMVPRHFVVLGALPVTDHGKVDRKALPPPTVAVSSDLGAPTDPQEREMVHIWKQVLNVEHVSPTDDFFNLGGTSINALRILASAGKRWNVDLQLAQLYKAPTVRLLLAAIRDHGGSPRWSNLAELRAEGHAIPVVCVHGDEGNHHLARLLPHEHPFYAFFHQGEDGTALKHRTIQSIAEHYLAQLEQALPEGPVVMMGYSMGGNIAVEIAHRLRAKGRDVPLLVLIDTFGPDRTQAAWSVKGTLLRVRDAMYRYRCRYYLKRGALVPVGLRTFHIMDTYTRAYRKYRSPGWSGPTFLVRSEHEAHRVSGWDRVCSDLTTIILPGDHLSIVKPGQIEPVAEQIRAVSMKMDLKG